MSRVADLAAAAASGLPAMADPGLARPPSPARSALMEIAARLERLVRAATMQMRLNRIARGARQLGLRQVALPHGMLKVRRRGECRSRGAHGQG